MGEFARVVSAGGVGLGLALLYAALAQALFRAPRLGRYLSVMSLSFLVGVPAATGLLAVGVALARQPLPPGVALVIPALACAFLASLMVALRREPPLTVLMALPLCLGAASGGGAVALLLTRLALPGAAVASLVAGGLLAPYVLALMEQQCRCPVACGQRQASIDIAADCATIWRNIIRVPPIAARERRGSLFTLVGIPRPHEATLTHEGTGGIRIGRFERGITFRETIVEWHEHRALRFTFQVDRSAPTPAPLGAIGGPHFDILDVAYRLEALPNGQTRLHLTCRDRLATPFNRYADLWLGAVMGDFQRAILRVIRARCEAEAASVAACATL